MTAEQWIQIRQLEQAFVLTKVIHHLHHATYNMPKQFFHLAK